MDPIDDRLMKDIVSDGRAHQTIISRGGNTAATSREPERGSGWRDSPQISDWKPTGSTTGQAAMDAMFNEADRLDRAARARQLAEAAALLKAVEGKEEKESGK
jgi:hypothetical protein